MLKNIVMRFLLSIAITACGAQDAAIQLEPSVSSERKISSVTSVDSGNPSDPSGMIRILAPSIGEGLPYSKFKLIFSIEDSDQLKDYSITLDGKLMSAKLSSGRSLYVEKEIPITSCSMGMIIAPGEHRIEVSYHDRLGNELKADTLFTLKQ
ncbi:MAG: hypothetical protein KGP28_09550 [Bdellovibrionales bacterium]|nr:hypothetical protein [Bdellovibrionales bacterium]